MTTLKARVVNKISIANTIPLTQSLYRIRDRKGNRAGEMTQIEALELTKKYASVIRSELDANAIVLLFGSHARNQATIDSDIDIAVVSRKFGKNVVEDFGRINILRHNISLDIEAHPVPYREWSNLTPFIKTIQTEGIAV